MPTRSGRERFTELLFYAVVLLVGYLVLLVVWPFLAPLAWAAILAMTLRPVYMYFCIRLSNANAALMTTVLAGLLIIAPAVFLALVVAQQVPLALDYVNNLSATVPAQVMSLWSTLRARLPFPIPADPTVLLTNGAEAAAAFLAGQAGSLVANVLQTFGSLLVMLFALFFMLRDGTAFAAAIRRLLPFSEPESDRLVREASDLVVASVGAGLLVAAVQGLIGGLAFWALGLPAPAVWGVAMTICALLPVVGATIVWGPTALWLFLSGDIARAVVLTAICAVVLGSADNVLRPLLLSGRTSASGLVVFVGLLGGVAAFGFVGLVVGPIVLVIAGTLIEALTRRVHLGSDETGIIEAP
ncbi:MAG: AI-2E family transporter [Vicinamibacterales bacterium]